jgi:integration host factor subunit beta
MKRSDLIEKLADRFSQLSSQDAEDAVKTVIDALSNALVRNNRVEIRGFGSFSLYRRAARTGRNPRNGESISIASTRAVNFKSGKALRESVNLSMPEQKLNNDESTA